MKRKMTSQFLGRTLSFSLVLVVLGASLSQAAENSAARSSGPSATSASATSSDSQPATSPLSATQNRADIVSVTKVVGEVGDRIVTSREVRINDAVEQAMTGRPTAPEGFRILTGQESVFAIDVGQVLDEWSVYFEAKSLSSPEPSKSEINRVIKAIQDKWGSSRSWRDLEVSQEELSDMASRKLLSQDFTRLKGDPQMAPVTDEEALVYYKKNRLRFGSLPFSSFKDSIKAYLIKQQTDRRLSEWHEVLRRKHKVRNFISG